MKSLISLSQISKSYGAKSLFSELSLTIHENEKVAIIGKNGAGKSTLLKLMAEIVKPESGEVVGQKHLRVAYIPQSPSYDPKLTVAEVVGGKYLEHGGDIDEQSVAVSTSLSKCGFENQDQLVGELSGGWLKRLSIASALVIEPQLLLLDEPTNHMDWQAIAWLEKLLISWRHSFVIISHDRYFLNKTTNRTIEIGQAFLNEHLSYSLPYDDYIVKRSQYFEEQQKLSESLSNKAKRELEWLRAGVKARTTKSRSRIKGAHELFENLNAVDNRIKASKTKVSLGIDESGRKTKKLLEFKSVSKSYGDKKLFTDLNYIFSPKTRLALLGENGSGKTTLIKILMGEVNQDSGEVKQADGLSTVYFDQSKATLNLEDSIFEFLAEGSEQVLFKGSPMHVASYASKFLFTKDHFYLKISQLSGGERARLQLAKILLKPCDILILDEPTNDLDIDSIEVLEDLLAELKTALVLISHDQSFISNVCSQYLALEGSGLWNTYADLNQWLNSKNKISNIKVDEKKNVKKIKKKAMSYKDKKELETIESDIQVKEAELEEINDKITQEQDPEALRSLAESLASLETLIQQKYKRWQDLEDLKS